MLSNFVDGILKRLRQHMIQFDHLKDSISLMHRHFDSYTAKTFFTLRKILEDLSGVKTEGDQTIYSGKPSKEAYAVINKILAEEVVSNRLFYHSETSLRQLSPIFEQQLVDLKNEVHDPNETFVGREAQINQLQQYGDLFKSIKNVKYLAGNNKEV